MLVFVFLATTDARAGSLLPACNAMLARGFTFDAAMDGRVVTVKSATEMAAEEEPPGVTN